MPLILIGRGLITSGVSYYLGFAAALALIAAFASLAAWASTRVRGQARGGAQAQNRAQISSWPRHGDVIHPHEMSRRLVAVQESVRREMADYLHGHVQSKLLALSMSLGICQELLKRDPEAALRTLERVREELQKVQDEDLRQVSRELYPSIIKMGLVPALRSLAGRFQDSLQVYLEIDPRLSQLDTEGESSFPEKQRLGIYRIAEEAMTNVVKHAQATRLEVRLSWSESQQLVLAVSDNGRGFNPNQVRSGQGLVGMADYAAALGGNAEIVSTSGQGTTVYFSLPLPGATPAAPLPRSLN